MSDTMLDLPDDAYGFVVLNKHAEPMYFTPRDRAKAEKAFLDYGSALIPVYRKRIPAPAAGPGIREALEECVAVLSVAEHNAFIDPDYGDEIAELGNRIGYGALMSGASAAWRERLEEQDCPTGGEFVAGPCHKTVVLLLEKARAALAQTHVTSAQREPQPVVADVLREAKSTIEAYCLGAAPQTLQRIDAVLAALTEGERQKPAPFYGAQCPTYPACNGGCGLGCTHEIEINRGSAK